MLKALELDEYQTVVGGKQVVVGSIHTITAGPDGVVCGFAGNVGAGKPVKLPPSKPKPVVRRK